MDTLNFNLAQAIEVLERTPNLLDSMLRGLSDGWTTHNEGGETWSPYDVMGHLIYGENSNWITRMEIILSDKPDKTFAQFDRFAQFELSKGKTLSQLLDEFKAVRQKNITYLKAKNLTEADLGKKGIHPAFGEVSLKQLLSTWTVHDLNHLAQISRVMAKQYKQEVGPWVEYLRILKS